MAKSWESLAKTLKNDPWHNAALELTKKKEVDTGIVENIFRGIKKSSAVAPFIGPVQEEAATFGGRLGEAAGELAGDIPAMSLGGTGGALAGAALGSVLGPVGTGIGALLGGGAGALMAPTAIKSVTREAQRGTPIVDAAGNIVSDIGKSALIGGLTAGAGRIAGPLLGRIGGKTGEKILSTGLGRGTTELAGELGGMTYGQHLTGEEITPEMLAQNLLTMGAMKGAQGIAGKLPIRRPTATIDVDALIGQPSPLKEQAFQSVREHVGERAAKVYKSQVAWQERLAKAEEQGKFTPQNLEDMIYYRQRTGGPKEGDTFEAVRERLPEHARTFVDKTISEHLNNSLKEWNENPYTKDIHPREELKDIYLPGLYEGTPGDFDRAMATLSRRFKISNPFANEKTFLTYNDALVKAGLKPRYNSMIDLMKHYDKVMIKSAANAEFASKLKKGAIVRPNSKAKYDAARKAGWVPFMDPFLRRFVAGKTEEGKLVFSKSELPALVNPEMAPALQGVFSKDAYKPDHPAWRYYDAISDRLKNWAVHLPFVDKIPGFSESPWSLVASPFHTWTLLEHATGDFGTKLFSGIKTGQDLLKDTTATADAIKHGLQLQRGDVGTTKNYLFGKLQPSFKLGSYHKFVNDVINDLASKGTPPDQTEIKKIKNQAADYANNVYGGQNWEIINWFNDKNNLKMARRATGYLDWSVSNIKNAAQVLGKDYQGQQARKMWARYGVAFLGTRAIIDAFNSSLVQTDKDKSPLGIRLDPEKFMNNLSITGQPGQRILFHLPDVDVNIMGHIYNPGRDEKGHKQFGHFGKSALEIYHYYQKPLSEMFTKSNPVFQQIYKQVTGTTPSEYGPMMVQRGWKAGQPMPWGGEEGYKQALARAKEVALSTVPFSMRAEGWGEAAKKYTATMGGMFPLNKGLTPFKAQERIAKALKGKDYKTLKDIQATLLENGYSLTEINKKIKTVRTDLLKRGELH